LLLNQRKGVIFCMMELRRWYWVREIDRLDNQSVI